MEMPLVCDHFSFGNGAGWEESWIVKVYRHGDLLISPVVEVPSGGRKRVDGIFARGEATGHAHRLEARGGVELWDFVNEIYFTVGAGGADVLHEEHRTIHLESGNYKVWRQRQYQPEGDSFIED
jgi:hypothetical protein